MILSTLSENNALNLIFGATAWPSKPATLYYALMTTLPTDAGGGVEVSAAGYSRHAATVGSTYFEAAVANGGNVTNKLAVSFGTATAAWGTVVGWAMYDAAAGGNLIAWGALPSYAVGVNFTPSYAIGAFVFNVSGSFGDWLGKSLLNHIFVGTAFPTVAKHYFTLGTSAGVSGIVSEPAIGTNAYARVAAANLVATYAPAADGAKSNAAAITFPASTGSPWGSMSHFALLTAGGIASIFTASDSAGSLLLTTGAAHNLAVGDIIQVANSGGGLPTNSAVLTDYYVKTIPSGTTLTISTTPGGAAVAWGGAGTGTHTLYPMTIWWGAIEAPVGATLGDAPSFAAGEFDIDLD
jgi:hypothetical protein